MPRAFARVTSTAAPGTRDNRVAPARHLALHRRSALVSLDLDHQDPARTPTLVSLDQFISMIDTGQPMRISELLPFQKSDGVLRMPTVWVATLRKLKTIVRCALPGDVVLVVRRRTVSDFYDIKSFNYAVHPGALIDMLAEARWLGMVQMSAVEKLRTQQVLLQTGDIYQVQPGTYFSHHMEQSNRDLAAMSNIEGVVHFYKIVPVSGTMCRYKQEVINDVVNYTRVALPGWKPDVLADMFLDGGGRLMDFYRGRMSPLETGLVVVDEETNARGVRFFAWTRRDYTLFNDQMIDPRELAIMGQHDAGYVLHQLGFPAGMACDEYLVRLCIKMKYLMRKGWGHLRSRDKADLVSEYEDETNSFKFSSPLFTRDQELDTRDVVLSPEPANFPPPRDFQRIRRSRTSTGKHPTREYLLTENL